MLDEAESRLARKQIRGWLRGSCSCCPVVLFSVISYSKSGSFRLLCFPPHCNPSTGVMAEMLDCGHPCPSPS